MKTSNHEPHHPLIIWTRSKRDWQQDQDVFHERSKSHFNVATQILPVPCLQTVAIETWEDAWENSIKSILDDYIVVFTSLMGAETAAARLKKQQEIYTPSHKVFDYLQHHGFKHAHLIDDDDSSSSATHFWPKLLAKFNGLAKDDIDTKKHFLHLGAKELAFDPAPLFKLSGHEYHHIACYQTEAMPEALEPWLMKQLLTFKKVIICFASPSAVHGFISLWDACPVDWSQVREKWCCVTIGNTTQKAASKYFKNIFVSDETSIPSLWDRALSLHNSGD